MSFEWPKGLTPTDPTVRAALRQVIIESIFLADSGHPGGSLSLVEILTSIFDGHFQHSSQNQNDPERDRLVLSKGHGVPALYALYSYLGYFSPAELANFRKFGHFLQGHPDHLRFPLMEASTGSLGQGPSIALGLAMGLRLQYTRGEIKRLPRVYCVMGDGESQEGQVWECLMSCGKFLPGNLVFVLDANNGQIDGPVNQIMNLEPIVDKIKAFRLDAREVDGHSVTQLQETLKSFKVEAEAPAKYIVARTVKGKGVPYMEHPNEWHGKAPNKDELKKCVAEIFASKGGVSPFGSIVEGAKS